MSSSSGADATSVDFGYMAQALRLARRGEYSTAPNPSVGCVLLDPGGAVVGEGWHRRAGEPHAEILALAEAGDRARGGTAYVTLEPCSHQGRTPPCVDAVLRAEVRRVVAAMQDPNPLVAGAGLRKLEAAGIAVTVGVLEQEARELNRGFVSRMTKRRPWVTLKVAASIDGRTALASGESKWITGSPARQDVQRLRARASAILTGIGTVVADDPALTVRDPSLATLGRQPLRVVFDTSGKIQPSARLLQDGQPTLIFTSEAACAAMREAFCTPVVGVEALPLRHQRLDLEAALRQLAQHECNEVLVEAGPMLAGAFVARGFVDEVVIYMAASVLGDTSRAMFELPVPLGALDERPVFAFHDVRNVGEDLRVTLRPKGK
jgi:diaminohydroxyphosphoribosylaminopyrimidine deaminase/5-amino-6-(5-phosphoribosylamino)uracil reductase